VTGAIDLIWAGGLSAIPIALLVGTLTSARWCRPATRHTLWLVVLLSFLTPGVALWLDVPRLQTGPSLPADTGTFAPAPSPPVSTSTAQTDVEPEATERTPPAPPGGMGVILPQPVYTSHPPESPERSHASSRPTTAGERKPFDTRPPPSPPAARDRRSAASGGSGLAARRRAEQPSGPLPPAIVPPPSPASNAERWAAPADSSPSRTTHGEAERAHATRASQPGGFLAAQPSDGPEADSTTSVPPPTAAPLPERVRGAVDSASVILEHVVGAWIRSPAAMEWRTYGAALRNALTSPPPIPVEAWLTGATFLLGLGLVRVANASRTLRRCEPATPEMLHAAEEAARLVGLPSTPRTVMTPRRVSPMVLCLPTPRIVIPVQLWSQLDEDGRLAVLVHEAAHLRRRDHWVCLVELLVSAVYWWHPIVWWTRRKLREEADQCCDAWVTMLMPRSRRAYAEALVMAKGDAGVPPAGVLCLAMASSHAKRLARRLTMVMTSSMQPRLSAYGAALAVAVAGAGTFITPSLACPPDRESTEREATERTTVAVAPSPPEPPSVPVMAPAMSDGVTPPPPLPAGAPATPAQPDASTFDEYMDRRGEPEGVEERLERLEQRLERIMEHLERMDGRMDDAPEHRARAGGVTLVNPGHVMVEVDEEATVALAYTLPRGKLGALSGLMVRSDVPVLVRPEDTRLIVYATPEQHEAFRNFALLVHPDGVKIETIEGQGGAIVVRGDDQERDENWEEEAEWDTDEDCETERASRRAEAEEALRAEMMALREAARNMRLESRNRHSQARTVARRAERVRREADLTEERAERAEEKSDELHERAEEYEEEARELDDGPRREKLLQKSHELFAAAEHFLREAEALEQHAEDLHNESEHLEEHAERVEEAAEELEQEAEELEREAEELQHKHDH